jgi:alpha-1,6-mannosyltransferase
MRLLYVAGLLLAACAAGHTWAWLIPPGSYSGISSFVADISAPHYVLTGAFYAGVLLVYGLWLRAALSMPLLARLATFSRSLAVAAPAALLAFAAYPTTMDVYAYLHAGEMLRAGINPYTVPAGEVVSVFSPFIGWHQTTTYGPIALSLFSLASLAAPLGAIAAVYLFKVFCLVTHCANGYGIWRLLSADPRRATLTTAYLLCPPLLFELVAQAHVDVFLISSIVWLYWALAGARLLSASAALIAGAMVKTIPAIWAPLLLVFLLRERRMKTILGALLLGAVVVGVLSATLLPTAHAWLSLLNPGVNWREAGSIHQLVLSAIKSLGGLVPAALSEGRQYRALDLGGKLVYLAWYVVLLRRTYAKKGEAPRELLPSFLLSLLLLFLIATPWYQPWYATPLLAMVVLLGSRRASTMVVARAAVLYAFGSAAYHVLAIPNGPLVAFSLVSLLTVVPASVPLARWILSKVQRMRPALPTSVAEGAEPSRCSSGLPLRK